MRYAGHVPTNDLWLRQVFAAKAVDVGGVVRRKRSDVERKVGIRALGLEVRRRGFHLVKAGDHLIVICTSGPI